MTSETDVVDPPTFREWLATLKRSGCNLLVTGEVRETVTQQMTRKLLGATDVPRTRLLALTDHEPADAAVLLPDDVDVADEDVHVLNYDCRVRTAAAAEQSAAEPGTGADRRDLDEFRTAICDAITRAKDAESGFDAAELRVSLFTLSYLASQNDPEAVERFVSPVCDHVRGVSGMGHYHLSVPDDAEIVRRLAPLFDVRIELREKHGLPEQRWHFPDRDASTSWIGL